MGHSAGGQFVNRYAGGTSIVQTAQQQGVTMSFGVFAPGQVLYLDDWRPNAKTACDGGPGEGDYRRYPDGLVGIEDNGYMNDSTPAQIKVRMFDRRIYYTVGQNDNVAFTGNCDKVQGDHRLDLLREYQTELWKACVGHFGGNAQAESLCQTLWFRKPGVLGELPNVGHSHKQEYETDRGINILFHWE